MTAPTLAQLEAGAAAIRETGYAVEVDGAELAHAGAFVSGSIASNVAALERWRRMIAGPLFAIAGMAPPRELVAAAALEQAATRAAFAAPPAGRPTIASWPRPPRFAWLRAELAARLEVARLDRAISDTRVAIAAAGDLLAALEAAR